ncbi:hypothetical protein PD374_17885 [Pseudomonas sp. WCS374]|nr:hypothetical protein PD374_17885 [Pseudomonas sp. WCS374]
MQFQTCDHFWVWIFGDLRRDFAHQQVLIAEVTQKVINDFLRGLITLRCICQYKQGKGINIQSFGELLTNVEGHRATPRFQATHIGRIGGWCQMLL